MKRLPSWMVALISLGCGLQQCAPHRPVTPSLPDVKAPESQSDFGMVPKLDEIGPKIEILYSSRVDALSLIEKASSWRADQASNALQVLDHRVGLDPNLKDALKKFGIIRSRLESKSVLKDHPVTFEQPFGPDGLFPKSSESLVERFWEAVVKNENDARLHAGLQGILVPNDAKILAFLMPAMNVCMEQLGDLQKFAAQAVSDLSARLVNPQVGTQLQAFGRFLGVDVSDLNYSIHPVWIPDYHDLEAQAYGSRILVSVPDTKGAGVDQSALVVHEIARRMMSLLEREKKSAYTNRFVEKTGFDGRTFYMLEGVLDAFSYGVVAPFLAAEDTKTIKWPGDEKRQKYAKALVPLLSQYFARKKPLDMGFVNRAAALCHELIPPKPADFLDGAMVIGNEESIRVFKSQVVRWSVWKFPLSKQYNYSKKLGDNPGKSVLLLALLPDLKLVRSQFRNVPAVSRALVDVEGYLRKNKKILLSLSREHRGHLFLLAAPKPEDMKKLASEFYRLKEMPSQTIVLD